jgi:hypothetical protein
MRINITGWSGNATNETIPSSDNGRYGCIMDINVAEEQSKALAAVRWFDKGKTVVSLQFAQNYSNTISLADYTYSSLVVIRLTDNFKFYNDSDNLATTTSKTYQNTSSILVTNDPGNYLFVSSGVANGSVTTVDYKVHNDLNGTNEGTVFFRPVNNMEYYPITTIQIDTLGSDSYNHTFQYAINDSGVMHIKNTMALGINLNRSEFGGSCSKNGASGLCSLCDITNNCSNCSLGGCSNTTLKERYISDGIWQVNVTAPVFACDYKDLFINATCNGLVNHTETSAIYYGSCGADSCTPPAIDNDWKIVDKCVLTNQLINLGIGDLNISESGSLTLLNSNMSFGKLNINTTTLGVILNFSWSYLNFWFNMSGI